MTPDSALQLQKLGYACAIESGAGAAAGFSDALYAAAGVTVMPDAAALYDGVDIIAKVRPPSEADAVLLLLLFHLLPYFVQIAHSAKKNLN